MKKGKLTHVNNKGQTKMVDISAKGETKRTAIAAGRVKISPQLLQALRDNSLAKGDALAVARIAGIQAVKKTAELIPLCHPLPISAIDIELNLADDPPRVEITSKVRAIYKTGVEMEALMATSVAALTVYDMGKAIDRGMIIENVRLLEKRGGKSGTWKRK